MAHWLYKYIFRGIGIVFLAGLLTNLYLVFSSHRHKTQQPAAPPAASERHIPGAKR